MSDDATDKPSGGPATASFILGLIAVPLSLTPIGGALGVGGIVLGARHLARRRGARRRAWLGIVLSAAAVVMTGLSIYAQAVLMRQARAAMAHWEGVPSPAFVVTTLDGTD